MRNKRILFYVLLILLSFVFMEISYAAQDADNKFPLTKGTEWYYEGGVKIILEQKSEDKKLNWKMSVLDSLEKDGSVAALIQGYPGSMGFYDNGKEKTQNIFINNGDKLYIYGYSEEPPMKVFNDIRAGKKKIDELIKNSDLLIEFPLVKDKIYGIAEGVDAELVKKTGKWCWIVDDELKFKSHVKGFENKNTLNSYLLSYRTNPDTTLIEFVPGLGIVNFEYTHHGTPGDVRAKLVKFSSEASAGISKPAGPK